MKIQRSVLDQGVAGIHLTGEFDAFAANPFLEQVEAIVQSGVERVVVNMRLVLFVNSTAIGSLIKARKRVRGLGGDLVLSEPSPRVKGTLETLGLGSVLNIFPSDEEAITHLSAQEGDAVDMPAENSVLVHGAGDKIVARMVSLEEAGMVFAAKAGNFEEGQELKVKFRLPLFRQSYYFHLPCTVSSVGKGGEGQEIKVAFGEIMEEDQRAIGQFVRDLRLLKDEIRSAGKD